MLVFTAPKSLLFLSRDWQTVSYTVNREFMGNTGQIGCFREKGVCGSGEACGPFHWYLVLLIHPSTYWGPVIFSLDIRQTDKLQSTQKGICNMRARLFYPLASSVLRHFCSGMSTSTFLDDFSYENVTTVLRFLGFFRVHFFSFSYLFGAVIVLLLSLIWVKKVTWKVTTKWATHEVANYSRRKFCFKLFAQIL